MELRILGSLQVGCGADRLTLRSGQQRRLLAALVVHAGDVVPIDRLIEWLWGDQPPSSAVRALRTHVSRLRASLARCGARDVVRTRVPGYVLVVEPGQLDVDRFEQLVRTARGDEDRTRRVALLDEALALWRGPALAEFAVEDFARAEAARLEGLRQVAIEMRADARLDLGQHAEVAVELDAVCDDQPLREAPHAQRMLALYRSGRPAEALAVYQSFRTRLAEELGLDPSPGMRELERRILRHDPALAPPSRTAPGAALGSRGPTDAPSGAAVVGDGPIVGRTAELASLAATAHSVSATSLQVVLVTGEAGVGKSRLLTQFGATLASEAGWSPPGAARSTRVHRRRGPGSRHSAGSRTRLRPAISPGSSRPCSPQTPRRSLTATPPPGGSSCAAPYAPGSARSPDPRGSRWCWTTCTPPTPRRWRSWSAWPTGSPPPRSWSWRRTGLPTPGATCRTRSPASPIAHPDAWR